MTATPEGRAAARALYAASRQRDTTPARPEHATRRNRAQEERNA